MSRQAVARLVLVIGTVVVLSGVILIGTARAATHAVDIAGFAFGPSDLTITVGDTVTWTNRDVVVHTATSTSGAFDTGDLGEGESASVTFTAPGTYDYLCTPHPTMTGRIVVVAAAATAAPTPGTIPNVAMPAESRDPLVVIGLVLLFGAVVVLLTGRRRVA
jgi:amicyanin